MMTIALVSTTCAWGTGFKNEDEPVSEKPRVTLDQNVTIITIIRIIVITIITDMKIIIEIIHTSMILALLDVLW